ncbi:MAG: protein kinase [Planctomycetota bacterium]
MLVDQAGRARLADFGIATALDLATPDPHRTARGDAAVDGPEAFRNAEATSKRSDVWSLGVLLYEALTDRLPFEGETIPQLMTNLTSGYLTPRTLSREIPRDLETVCMRALETNPFRRYPDANAFADELRRYLRGEPVLARRRWRRPKLVHLAALGVAAALLGSAGVLGVALTRPRPIPPESASGQEVVQQSVVVPQVDVAAFVPKDLGTPSLPGLEVLMPWACERKQGRLRIRFNGGTSPELRLPCRYDGVTPVELRARLRVPLLLPGTRVGLAFQRWQRDATPQSPELEERGVDDFLVGADDVEREALYLELAALPGDDPFGVFELRAGTQDEVRWRKPFLHALGPLRELSLRLRFDPREGVTVDAELDGRRVARGEFPCEAQPKGEWLLRIGGNLSYAGGRFGLWRGDGHPTALGQLDLVSFEVAARDAAGVTPLDPAQDADPRHELGRIGRALLAPDPDYAAIDPRLEALHKLRGEATREEVWVASTARYLRNLSLGARGRLEEARDEWFRDLSSYRVQGASPRAGTVGWLGWRWCHDAPCYDEVTRQALTDGLMRLYQIESAQDYLKRLLVSGGRGSAEGLAALRFPERPEFGAQRWTFAWLLSLRDDAKARRGLRAELAFQAGALEWLRRARITPEDFGTLTPTAVVGVRFGRILGAVAAGDLKQAQAEVDASPQVTLLDDAAAWLERLR